MFTFQADNLRQQTLQQMHRILTTRQSARALLAIHDYLSRLRALSSLWLARPREWGAKFDCSFWLLMTVELNCLIGRVACSSHGWISCCLLACRRQRYCILATRKSTSVMRDVPCPCKKPYQCCYSVCLWCSGSIGCNNTFTHLVMFRWEMHVICVCDYRCGAVLLTIWGCY